MRTRTVYCSHGFFVPDRPEPWRIPASEGGVELKASRYCAKCWETNREIFLACGCSPIDTEDRVTWGFLDLIHYALKAHVYSHDQAQYEDLEMDLRMHLNAKRRHVEDVLRNDPDRVDAYVRVLLRNKLIDLNRRYASSVEQNSVSVEAEPWVVDGLSEDRDPDDESQISADIVEATQSQDAAEDVVKTTALAIKSRDPFSKRAESWVVDGLLEDRDAGGENQISAEIPEATQSQDTPEAHALAPKAPDPPANRAGRGTHEQDNTVLLKAEIEEQGHRLDPLAALARHEEQEIWTKARRNLLPEIAALPADEHTVIRLRFLNGEGNPRPRSAILRELRANGNVFSKWSDSVLRRLETQAISRLRSKLLPPSSNDCS